MGRTKTVEYELIVSRIARFLANPPKDVQVRKWAVGGWCDPTESQCRALVEFAIGSVPSIAPELESLRANVVELDEALRVCAKKAHDIQSTANHARMDTSITPEQDSAETTAGEGED